MHIIKDQKYLYISMFPSENGDHFDTELSVLGDWGTVLSKWNAGSRVSPIWRLKNDSLPEGGADLFTSGSTFFVSMMNPAELEVSLLPRVQEEIPSLRIFSSLGVCNVVLSVSNAEEAGVLSEYLEDGGLAYEEWRLDGSICKDMAIGAVVSVDDEKTFDLERLQSDDLKLKSKHVELATNILAAARRGHIYFPWIEGDLEKVLNSYCQSLQDISASADDERAHYLDTAYYRIINANSAISRFTSQALTGTQPIESSEGHYWPHSALGVGIASAGVRNVAAFISDRIGEFEFVDRVFALANKPYEYNARPVDLNFDELNVDLLSDTPFEYSEKIVPICFFSGRDSFKHDIYSLSLPLETIEAATCHQWSLRTVTHELTHRIVEPILGALLPQDFSDLLDSNEKSKLFMGYKPGDLLEAAHIAVLDSLMALARNDNREFIDRAWRDTSVYEDLFDVIIDCSPQMEEYIVHTFDYFYFYNRDPEEYIKSLWLSWGIIPYLEGRLDEYIVRSIVALSANTIHLSDSIEVARQQFLRSFKNKYIEENNPHYDTVLERVESEEYWSKNLEYMVTAGNVAARFTVMFLYSDKASTHLYQDAALESGEGYGVRKGHFSTRKYTNPLRLMQEFSVAESVSASDSAWLFHILAFNAADFR